MWRERERERERERDMNEDHFSGIFLAFNFKLGDGEISIKKRKIPIIYLTATQAFCNTV